MLVGFAVEYGDSVDVGSRKYSRKVSLMASDSCGRTLARVMFDNGFTASELARKSGLNINTVYRVRDGKTADPSDWVRKRICDALGSPEGDIEWGERPDVKEHVWEREKRGIEKLSVKLLTSALLATFATPANEEIARIQIDLAEKITARLKAWHLTQQACYPEEIPWEDC